MSNTIKIVHDCNHVVPEKELVVKDVDFVRGSGLYDVVSDSYVQSFGDIDAYLYPKSFEDAGFLDIYDSYGNTIPKMYNLKIPVKIDNVVEYIEVPESQYLYLLPENVTEGNILFDVRGVCFENQFRNRFLEGLVVTGATFTTSFGGMIATGDGSSNLIKIEFPVWYNPEHDPIFFAKKKFYLEIIAGLLTPGCLKASFYVVTYEAGIQFPTGVFKEGLLLDDHVGFANILDLKHLSDTDFILRIGMQFEYESPTAATGKQVGISTGSFFLSDLTRFGLESESEEDIKILAAEFDDVLDCIRGVDFYVNGENLAYGITVGRMIDTGGSFSEGNFSLIPIRVKIQGSSYYSVTDLSVPTRFHWYDSDHNYLGYSNGCVALSPSEASRMVVEVEVLLSEENPLFIAVSRGQVVTTKESEYYQYSLTENKMARLPNGIFDEIKIENQLIYNRIGKESFYDIVDKMESVNSGFEHVEVVTLSKLYNQAIFTGEAEGRVLLPFFQERAFLDSPLNQYTYFTDPVDQRVKLVFPKSVYANLQAMKDFVQHVANDQSVYYEYLEPQIDTIYRRYYIGKDFERFGDNKIRWNFSGDESEPYFFYPREGKPLSIRIETRRNTNRSYEGAACPRCNGNGWYVSMIEDASGAIANATDIDKMVQDFLKILLTDVRYYSPGTAFVTLRGSVIRPEKTEALIQMYIRDAETQLKQIQYTLSISGSEISKYEELKTVIIEHIDTETGKDTVYVELRLVNQASEYTSVSLEI